MTRWLRFVLIGVFTVSAAGCFGCDDDDNGGGNPLAPSGGTAVTPGGTTPGGSGGGNPVAPESQRLMLVEVGSALRDPAFPGTAQNAVWLRLWGQIRNALAETPIGDEGLSGGQGIVTDWSCPDRWAFRVGFDNGTPIEQTNATFWQSIAVCDTLALELRAQLAPTNRVVGFDLSAGKARIVNSGVTGQDSRLIGPLPQRPALQSAAQIRQELQAQARAGQIPSIVYYENLVTGEVWERNFVTDTIRRVR